MTYNYKQVAEITGKKVANLRGLVSRLGIKTKVYRGRARINKEDLEILIQHCTPKISKINDKYKIRIVERYFVSESYRDVSRVCRVNKSTVKRIVDEWRETGYLTIDSSINFPEKQQSKNIFYRNKSWGYSFMFKGNRYYKRGFLDEGTAMYEMVKLKESLLN